MEFTLSSNIPNISYLFITFLILIKSDLSIKFKLIFSKIKIEINDLLSRIKFLYILYLPIKKTFLKYY